MREWRKLYSSALSSERLTQASFEARWLWTLLVAAQDDEGSYPWGRINVKSLCVSTEWSLETATAYRDELARLELLTVHGEGAWVTLYRGKELNGNPRPDRYDPFTYPNTAGPQPVPSQAITGPQPVPSQAREKRKEKKLREEREDTQPGTIPSNGSLLSLSSKQVSTAFERANIKLETWHKKDVQARLQRGTPLTAFLDAIQEAASHEAFSYGYTAKILDRLEQQGWPTRAGPGPPGRTIPAQSESKPYREVFGETTIPP